MSTRPAKITKQVRAEVIRRVRSGESYASVARDVGLAHTTVRNVALAAGVASQVRSTAKSDWNEQFVKQWKGTR